MKYAKFSDEFLSDFRLDDNGETLVLTDKRGYTRAVKLLPYEERPQGEWKDESRDSLLCTCCNKRIYKPFIGGFPTERSQHYYPNFCAFCGADMRKGGAE